jgi:uracil-DNA glycosylase
MSKKISDVNIEKSWKIALAEEFEQPYFAAIKAFLVKEKQGGKIIYPPGNLIFNAFNTTPLDKVKVVILGQDPYHGPNQAMGLSFSVSRGVKVPTSLQRIYKELSSDIPGFQIPNHGDLTAWANQGVFLLNAALTVEQHKANSHQKIGWHKFTDAVIKNISDKCESVVFLLWGNFARQKKEWIDTSKHPILEAPHPSPLAQGFLGCQHFSKCNALLVKNGKTPIDWRLHN